jgi:DNA-binding winged helix-turn-helix (wHTH) protein/TolB-like protein
MSHHHFADWQFDETRGELKQADTVITLRHKVANLLAYLLQHRDRVVSKEELLQALWQHSEYRDNALTQSIRELRKALGDQAQQPTFIRTYPQRGYQWICPLTTAPTPELQHADQKELQPAAPKKSQPEAQIEPQLAPQLGYESEADSAQTSKKRWPWLLPLLMTVVALMAIWWWPQPNTSGIEEGVLILPFSNQTGDSSQDWLQLGLADMVFVALQQRSQHRFVAPHQARQWLAQAGIKSPALPVHLQALLSEYHLDAALQASVREHQGQQVLDFQLLFADGRQQQGSISYPSLAASSHAVAQQLQRLLEPGETRSSALPKAQDPVAATAMAEGISALQHQGAAHAKRYFAASQVIEPDNLWIQALTAHAQVMTGEWQAAETLLQQLQQQPASTMFSAYVHYWLAQLRWRQGLGPEAVEPLLQRTLELARQSQDQERIIAAYQLQSRLAWQQNDWLAHQQALQQMQQHLPDNADTGLQADSLFYQGNPAEVGLERSPLNDLQHNAEQLQQALNLYQQLQQTPDIVASHFALARNFSLPIEQRQQHLEQALTGYQQLRYPYELMQVQIYAGYFYMQLHRGDLAHPYFVKAGALADELNSHHWQRVSAFYQGFALLDQGLDQRARGGHGQQPQQLRQAITQLERYLSQPHSPHWHAAARLFLGWAYNDLGEHHKASEILLQAYQQNQRLNMPVTAAYADFSWMYAQLQLGQPRAVIEHAGQRQPSTRLQARYLARAWHEIGQPQQAAAVLEQFAQRHPELWRPKDELRLADYHNAVQTSLLDAELQPHLVYCESDWQLPDLSQFL